MPRVLGVHGIAQQFKGGYELETVWFDALRDGLAAAGYRPVADSLAPDDMRVAFFGDLFRPKGALAGGGPPYTAADVQSGPERDLLAEFYQAAVKQDPSLGRPPGAMGSGRAAVQAMLEQLLRSRTFARVAQRGFIGNLKQVTAFLATPDIKERVLQRVHAEVTPGTQIIIGHSLGSVVVYEFIARYSPPQVELLITLGSPLGIPNLVFDKLTSTPADGLGAWPGTVAGWVNVADPDDIVALRKQLAPLFPAPGRAAGVEDHLVDNGDEPHAISRYLNAEPTGGAGQGAVNPVAKSGDQVLLAAGTGTYQHGADFEERLEDLDRVPDALRRVVETLTGLGYQSQSAGAHKYLLNPSSQQLREAVRAAAGAALVVVVYYTGHGLKREEDPYYLITTETRPDRLEDTALEARQFLRLVLRKDPHGGVLPGDEQPQVLMILDCCFSGTGGLESLRESLERMGNPKVWVLASASSLEYAQQGQFAMALKQALLDPDVGASQQLLGLDWVTGRINEILEQAGQEAGWFPPRGRSTGLTPIFTQRISPQSEVRPAGSEGCGRPAGHGGRVWPRL